LSNSPLIKILLVYYEPIASGQTTHVFSLAKKLDRRKYQIEIIIPNRLSLSVIPSLSSEVKITPLPIQKVIWKFQALSYFKQAVREHPNTIVHIHSQEAGIIGRPLTKVFGGKLIFYTPQTIDIQRKQYYRLYIYIERILAKLTDHILSVNEADRRRLLSWGISPKKVDTVYNGIDLDEFYQAEDQGKIRNSLQLQENTPLIMQIGRLSIQKSPLNFVEGARIILTKLPKVQFVMVGSGPLSTMVKKRIRDLGLERKIILAGAHKQAFRLIPAADIVTLTSLWEGTPYSLLEAMAWQKPVVATSVNGCPEVVSNRETGLLVPPNDPDQWASAVMEVISNPSMAETFGKAGRRLVEEKFTITRMVQSISDLYEEAITA
jgi:glycosyltransferase involved in cell wall biosynthesis